MRIYFLKKKTICEQQNFVFTHSTTSGLIHERRRRRDLNRTIPTSSSRKGEFLIVERVIY